MRKYKGNDLKARVCEGSFQAFKIEGGYIVIGDDAKASGSSQCVQNMLACIVQNSVLDENGIRGRRTYCYGFHRIFLFANQIWMAIDADGCGSARRLLL
jgi:hypothetical protein